MQEPHVVRADDWVYRRSVAEDEIGLGWPRLIAASAMFRTKATFNARPLIVWIGNPGLRSKFAVTLQNLPWAVIAPPTSGLLISKYSSVPLRFAVKRLKIEVFPDPSVVKLPRDDTTFNTPASTSFDRCGFVIPRRRLTPRHRLVGPGGRRRRRCGGRIRVFCEAVEGVGHRDRPALASTL